MKTTSSLLMLLLVSVPSSQHLFAGPLSEKFQTERMKHAEQTLPAVHNHRNELAAAVTGVLVGQHEMWKLNKGGRAPVLQYSGLASTHIQNAAMLLQKIDSLPGSFSHALMNGTFRSFGDGTRSANPLFKRALYELLKADQAGIPSQEALNAIYKQIGGKLPPNLVSERKRNLLENVKYIKAVGLDSPENLTLLSEGKAPRPTRGAARYVGKPVEVDHKVARSEAPQFENEVANLRLLPEEINRTKLAAHGKVEQEHLGKLTKLYRPIKIRRITTASAGGLIGGSGVSVFVQAHQGEDLNWGMVTKSGGIGLASGAATMVLAQQIEQKFVRQIAQSFIAKNLLPGLARGSLSGATASSGIEAVAVLGFVAKDYFTDQISADEALIQSGIGLGSAGVGFGVGVIATMATAGTILGTSVPIVGNAFGFVVGALAGAAVYAGGDWYYENFKLQGIRAEMAAFKQTAAKWEAEKMEKEITTLRKTASSLRAEAAKTFHP